MRRTSRELQRYKKLPPENVIAEEWIDAFLRQLHRSRGGNHGHQLHPDETGHSREEINRFDGVTHRYLTPIMVMAYLPLILRSAPVRQPRQD